MNGVFKTKNTTYSIIIVFNISSFKSFIISHYIYTRGGGGGGIYTYIYIHTPVHRGHTLGNSLAQC